MKINMEKISLIYIIATVMYLILDIIKNYKINTKKGKIKLLDEK